jgi:hypothetical protein
LDTMKKTPVCVFFIVSIMCWFGFWVVLRKDD